MLILILIMGVAALVGFAAFIVVLFGCCIGYANLVGVACTVSLVSLCFAWLLVRVVERG